jgi:hypothetical protein
MLVAHSSAESAALTGQRRWLVGMATLRDAASTFAKRTLPPIWRGCLPPGAADGDAQIGRSVAPMSASQARKNLAVLSLAAFSSRSPAYAVAIYAGATYRAAHRVTRGRRCSGVPSCREILELRQN